jgi:hypothetical protein
MFDFKSAFVGASTGTASTTAELVEHLKALKAKMADIPPPTDLHVTPQFYQAIKAWYGQADALDAEIPQLGGVQVIPDLPPDSPVPYRWIQRQRFTTKEIP